MVSFQVVHLYRGPMSSEVAQAEVLASRTSVHFGGTYLFYFDRAAIAKHNTDLLPPVLQTGVGRSGGREARRGRGC